MNIHTYTHHVESRKNIQPTHQDKLNVNLLLAVFSTDTHFFPTVFHSSKTYYC